MSDKKELSPEAQENLMRYERALHAMQSGVAMSMQNDLKDTEPKHLRVGVNSAMVETSALAALLIQKGVFTDEEYTKALADSMEREVRLYEQELSHGGPKVTLI